MVARVDQKCESAVSGDDHLSVSFWPYLGASRGFRMIAYKSDWVVLWMRQVWILLMISPLLSLFFEKEHQH